MSAPLLSDQQCRSLIEAQARINVWEGAIRSGKTIVSLARWLTHLAQQRSVIGEPFVFGRTRDSIARNVFAPLISVPLLRALAPGTHYAAGAATATVLGQTVHVIGASDRQAEEKLRGMTGKSAYGDELTVLPELFVKQVLGRLSAPGAALFATTNPDNPGHWLKVELLDRAGELDLATWHFTIDDNPYLSPEYVASIKAEYTGLWYRRMILGEWVQAEGAIYEAFDPDRHVVDELPDIERVLGVGIDYGTTNPFAAVALAVTRDGRLAVVSEYRHDSKAARRQLTDAEYSGELQAWLDTLDDDRVGGRPKILAVDPSAASFIEQLHRDRVGAVTDADNAVLDGIRLVASLIASDRIVVHRSCAGLIRELPGYVWDDTAAQKGEDKPVKAHDHSLDALRYAVMTTQAWWRRHVPLARWQG